ncbi:hypothetical protein AYO21_05508 [Fonsecaea monophora]|uniref:BTB domain-containing protein n=1 Tax=Fonsecaea monophora TaxID=254056 RepID=A0A177F7L3_9EURO|nr:hypothetical protein AYO21_05508 [Fonsecaea monophora]KAH0845579.1 hypothetical protein FOPE_12274 [Fonsecaea pedrosoi]OAG40225.1 hypothetical protein AYO21_05508 [Fonsecaea monophora]
MSDGDNPTWQDRDDEFPGKDPGPVIGKDSSEGTEIYSFADIVLITVGKEKVKFGVHKEILVSQCSFFDKCLRGGMKEAQENAVTLWDDDPGAFGVLVEWMYTSRLDHLRRPGGVLVNAYVLADKYGMPALQNAIVDRFRVANWSGLRNVLWAWGRLAEGSQLRKLFVDQVHYQIAKAPEKYRRGSTNTVDACATAFEEIVEMNAELTTALMWKMFDHSGGTGSRIPTNPASLVGCVYHLHDDGGQCKQVTTIRQAVPLFCPRTRLSKISWVNRPTT